MKGIRAFDASHSGGILMGSAVPRDVRVYTVGSGVCPQQPGEMT